MASLTNASWLGQQLGPVVAEPVVCAYPISDIFAPTPRYLYYGLLALIFLLNRYIWITKVFLGAAVAYAGTAAINVFILYTNRTSLPLAQNVSIPYLEKSTNASSIPPDALIGTDQVQVQPNALDLDLDAVASVVITAYLLGLPLQTWSTTIKSSRIVRYMILVWNIVMFAASICALASWPDINTGPEQFRFCYAEYPDPPAVQSDGWNPSVWVDSWNATVKHIFTNPGTVWQNFSQNCFYPCFNTTQVMRRPQSLRATTMDSGIKFAKLHSLEHFENDPFAGVIYFLIALFSAAQAVLFLAPVLHLCSKKIPVNEPANMWKCRKNIWKHLKHTCKSNVVLYKRCWCSIRDRQCDDEKAAERTSREPIRFGDFLITLQLMFDPLVILILLLSLTLFPLTAIAFICWIEWYIRNDGPPSEGPDQVGQWSAPVSLAIVLVATASYQLKDRVASKAELETEIGKAEKRLQKLQKRLDDKSLVIEVSVRR